MSLKYIRSASNWLQIHVANINLEDSLSKGHFMVPPTFACACSSCHACKRRGVRCKILKTAFRWKFHCSEGSMKLSGSWKMKLVHQYKSRAGRSLVSRWYCTPSKATVGGMRRSNTVINPGSAL